MIYRQYNNGGLELKVSPFLHEKLIRAVNVERDMAGAWKKRAGYTTYLNDVNGTITSLFNFQLNNGTQFWNYSVSGGSLFYSTQGTGDWTICGAGTLTNGARPGRAILANTMVIGDGTATTRHTTNGTSFSDTSGAPKASQWLDFQNRIYAGSGSSWFWSTTGTPTDWSTDSSSIEVPGPGAINWTGKISNAAIASKNSGVMFSWDGFRLTDLATTLGPTSPYSVAKVEDFNFFLNRRGVYGFGGIKPEILSNPIERQIYNGAGGGITGGTFDFAPGVAHKYDYFCTVGTITDDLTNETLSKATLVYDYRFNEWRNYDFAHLPTSWLSFKNNSGDEQLVFGDATGQCYTTGGTNTTDNGSTITAVLEWLVHLGAPELTKRWSISWFFFNPGMNATLQIAYTDTFTKANLNWITIAQGAKDGCVEYKHKPGSTSKLMLVKVTESSRSARFHYYGSSHAVDGEERR